MYYHFCIWNDALVFVAGAGTGWTSSIIIGFWGVCVIVGVWSSSTVRSYMDGNTMYQVLYCCFILMGVNSDGLCVITSNVTDWRASCVIILGI